MIPISAVILASESPCALSPMKRAFLVVFQDLSLTAGQDIGFGAISGQADHSIARDIRGDVLGQNCCSVEAEQRYAVTPCSIVVGTGVCASRDANNYSKRLRI